MQKKLHCLFKNQNCDNVYTGYTSLQIASLLFYEHKHSRTLVRSLHSTLVRSLHSTPHSLTYSLAHSPPHSLTPLHSAQTRSLTPLHSTLARSIPLQPLLLARSLTPHSLHSFHTHSLAPLPLYSTLTRSLTPLQSSPLYSLYIDPHHSTPFHTHPLHSTSYSLFSRAHTCIHAFTPARTRTNIRAHTYSGAHTT